MYLFLDNSAEEELFFYVIRPGEKIEKYLWRGAKARRGPLFCFDELLKKKKFRMDEIEGIGVRVGVGRFTATRIATTFVNSLGYFLKKPVIGLVDFSTEEFDRRIRKAKPGIYVSAKYSAMANIGRPKK